MPVLPRIIRMTVAAAAVLWVSGCGAPDPIAERYQLEHTYSTRDPQFRRVMDNLLGPHIVSGNSITTLVNGDEFYPAQLEAIQSAQRSINLETYMYWAGDIGERFAQALASRAEAGLDVNVVIDAVGSEKIDEEYITLMEEAGVRVIRYNPVERLVLLITIGDVTSRTHRKLLIVDGEVGFTGGAGIADVWLGDAENPDRWRDTFYRIEGPVVAQLQAAFVDNWIASTGETLHTQAYFPALEPAGELPAQVFLSSPEGGSASMELMYLLAINSAERTIDIATPYFVPDELFSNALLQALARGVQVRLLVPGEHIDIAVLRHASRSTWQPLLEAGMELYEYQPTMYHAKLIVIDGVWASIGSTNLDPFSFRLNDEANVNVYDESFARQQIALFERDLAHARRITELKHEDRSFFDRVQEFFASLWRPFLD